MSDEKNVKSEEAYKTIGEASRELGLVDKKTGSLQTHTLRYWERQFKQIKPLVRAGNRRYYSKKNLLIIKLIKFLLRDKGMTINGVKKILDNQKVHSLDDNINLGIYKPNQQSRKIIKDRVKNISKIIAELKLFK
tara:strand:- start:301 stop:705 length:405 start_codon:yes stop_codon:yes gene_type:complete